MDFKYHYSAAQESFRNEVSAWLDANLDESFDPAACLHPSADDWPVLFQLRQMLGGQGWLHPQAPPKQGGGVASHDERVVLAEELERRGLGWLQDRREESLLGALERWAAPALAQELAARLGRGEIVLWHAPFDPEAQPLPSDIDLWAWEDGDEYVLNGESRFAGMGPGPDLLWTLARLGAGPDETVHAEQPLACCLVPASSRGLALPYVTNLNGQATRPVVFEDVRVPRYCLLGEPGTGARVMADALSTSTADHALVGTYAESEESHRCLLEAALASPDPDRQQMAVQAVMDSYIDSRVARLFRQRNACLQQHEGGLTYHRAQTRLWERRAGKRLAEAIDNAGGPYALLDQGDPRMPNAGRFPLKPRFDAAWDVSEGHWLNDRQIIARWLGMAAPVANSHQANAMRPR